MDAAVFDAIEFALATESHMRNLCERYGATFQYISVHPDRTSDGPPAVRVSLKLTEHAATGMVRDLAFNYNLKVIDEYQYVSCSAQRVWVIVRDWNLGGKYLAVAAYLETVPVNAAI